jgi:hypothetical protein
MSVGRDNGGANERSSVEMTIISVTPTTNPNTRLVYADLEIVEAISLFGKGFAAPLLGLGAGRAEAPPLYSAYLAACRKEDPWVARDLKVLRDNGFTVQETLPPLAKLLFTPGKVDELIFFQLSNRKGELLESPEGTNAFDDGKQSGPGVVLPWVTPLKVTIGGQPWTLLGLRPRFLEWLETAKYLRPEVLLSDEKEITLCRVLRVKGSAPTATLDVELPGGVLSLKQDPIPAFVPEKGDDNIALVNAKALALMFGHIEGRLLFDPIAQRFTSRPQAVRYTRARLYARSIDDVPALCDALRERLYNVDAQEARILEINQQDAALQVLVIVVGAGVFAFGVLTVFSVLHDSTDRKRGTIGILRVMGASRIGVFLLIFVRAAIIGLLACGLCALLGLMVAALLGWVPSKESWATEWKPTVAIDFASSDYVVIVASTLVCCLAGAFLPAWRASGLDPFDAIVEGRFR